MILDAKFSRVYGIRHRMGGTRSRARIAHAKIAKDAKD